jgi:tetraacyldisaccharide 4'-kinase
MRLSEAAGVDLKRTLHAFHRRLCDPAERGPSLAICRALLLAPSALYALAVRARNRPYDSGRRKGHHPGVPVISIGNITAGGTGKTPFTAWLVGLLKEHGMRPAVLSRGYGADAASGLDDENQLLASLAPGVPIVADPDRIAGAEKAIHNHSANVLVLDDGFQHRRMARDMDIVLIDALNPFGGGHVLPRGLLREPPSALRRADLLIVTRADQVPQEQLSTLAERLRTYAPDVPLAHCIHRPAGLRSLTGGGKVLPLEMLKDGRWAAFCGIGNPEAFRLTLQKLGAETVQFTAFPDHHVYRPGEVAALLAGAEKAACKGVVTTEKDAVKIARLLPATSPLAAAALEVRIELTEGREALERLISALTPNEPAR